MFFNQNTIKVLSSAILKILCLIRSCFSGCFMKQEFVGMRMWWVGTPLLTPRRLLLELWKRVAIYTSAGRKLFRFVFLWPYSVAYVR
jgi:hypothetical protein